MPDFHVDSRQPLSQSHNPSLVITPASDIPPSTLNGLLTAPLGLFHGRNLSPLSVCRWLNFSAQGSMLLAITCLSLLLCTSKQWIRRSLTKVHTSSMAPGGERAFAVWRLCIDILMIIYVWTIAFSPGDHLLLRSSVCPNNYMQSKLASAVTPPGHWFSTFTGAMTAHVGPSHAAGIATKRLHTHPTLQHQSTLIPNILSRQWWWAWISAPACTLTTSSVTRILLFLPATITLPLLGPTWWILGGRSLVLTGLRAFTSLQSLLFFLLPVGHHAEPWEQLQAGQDALHGMFVRTALGAVPWRLQLPLTAFEVTMTVLAELAKAQFSPPLLHSRLLPCAAILAGTILGLAANLLEYTIVRLVLPPSMRAEDHDALGPMHALKLAANSWGRAAKRAASWGVTVETCMHAVLLAACVVVLTMREDIILFL